MTTINNLTIEQMREIVEGAPDWPVIGYCIVGNNYIFKQCEYAPCSYSNLDNAWSEEYAIHFVSINDLRTAIAEHDSAQLCIGCGSPDLHKGGEIKEPKMCLDCFAEMVGFTRTSNGFVESDDVTDIRNHLSPSTVVWDLASGEDLTAEAERHG